jgi:type VI secretion system protein ImpA
MSELEDNEARVDGWLQPLADASAPCGPDLEYDNDFLQLTQASLGKPESQFGPAEPPDWPAVRAGAEGLLDRSRDLRLAIFWLRSGLRLQGYAALAPGLRLISGLISQMWEHVHPLPDPDDGDPYARVNALTLLREVDGVIGDLRATRVVQDRAIGELLGRAVEVAAGIAQPGEEEVLTGKDQVQKMMAAAVQRLPTLRAVGADTVARVRELQAAIGERLDTAAAPDLRPLQAFVGAVVKLMPGEPGQQDAEGGSGGELGEGGASVARGPGISGSVNSRAEALRAIDMVCDYLEQAEPSNPAPLFLRRARQLVNHNFLQLMKELAPSVMPDVARIVGVDPETVETPERG